MIRLFMWVLLVLGLCMVLVFIAIQNVTNQGISHPTVASTIESRFCVPGETVVEVQGPSSPSTFSFPFRYPTTLIYCEADDGSRRDITISYATFIMTLSGVPFLLGLLLIIGSGSGIALQSRRARTRAYQQQFQALSRGGHPAKQSQMSPDAQATFDQVFANLVNQPNTTIVIGDTEGDDLSKRLEQLEKARKAGMITDQQYEQARAALKDAFKD